MILKTVNMFLIKDDALKKKLKDKYYICPL